MQIICLKVASAARRWLFENAEEILEKFVKLPVCLLSSSILGTMRHINTTATKRAVHVQMSYYLFGHLSVTVIIASDIYLNLLAWSCPLHVILIRKHGWAVPDFGVSTVILNLVDIFSRGCKLNFGLQRGHVKSRHFTTVLPKRQTRGDNIFTFHTYLLE